MKLNIEKWIDNNNFSENVKVLFQDSITCYKASANRASLLFSYLAFMTILKERIIQGVKPKLFPQGEWNDIVSKLQKEDMWEACVFEATQQIEKIDQQKKRIKDPIFNLNDNLRMQIKYWKDRRNDCAHYKDNIIDYYHIESFWAFIESNLLKITIEGGMQSLINKIYKHFDPTITPPDKDISPLIREIEFSVERTKLNEFWGAILDIGDNNFELTRNIRELISISLDVNNDFVNESLISIIKGNKYYLKDFLSNHTDKVLCFKFTPKEIREFWKTQFNSCNNVLGIYASFLRNCLIPRNEIDEANRVVFNSISRYSLNHNDHQILSDNGFFNICKEELFENNNFVGQFSFKWVNDRADIIAGIIKEYPADKSIIMRLVDHYNQENTSNWLLERFDNIFTQGSKVKNDYVSFIQLNNIIIPDILQKYFE
ncbi:MAG: hypothetical protein VB011_04600 [Bacteroidales bacterium]|nr:hypothetical protein [Bacteroidales bacterium]